MKIQNFKGWLTESAAPVPDTMIEDGLEIVGGLVDRGFDPKVAAAIAGNMWQESKFDPTAKSPGSTYVGLIQWGDYQNQKTGPGARKTNLMSKPNWQSIDAQLDYVKAELSGAYKSIVPAIMSAPTIEKAAEIVTRRYEGTTHAIPTRQGAAAQLYSAWQANTKPVTAFDPAQVDQAVDDTAFGEPQTAL